MIFIRRVMLASRRLKIAPRWHLLAAVIVLAALPPTPGRARAAEAENVAVSGQAETKKTVEHLLAVLADNPGDQAALNRLATVYYQQGDYRRADQIQTRLLKLVLDDPAAALPHVMNKWHLRQEYEAQAAMIRELRLAQPSPGNAQLLQTVLAENYDPASVVAALKPEFPLPEELAALEKIDAYWRQACERTRSLEADRDAAGLERHVRALFGDADRTRVFHALWRYFALVHREDLDGAEMTLKSVASAVADPRVRMDAVTASGLLAEIRRSPLAGELMDALSGLVAEVSSAAEERLSADPRVGLTELFDQANQQVQDREFANASATLDEIRPLLADNNRKTRYIYLHAETLWGLGEFARANQGHVASSVLQKERYFLSTAIFRMGEYAAKLHKRDEAAELASRSAGIMRENSWVLRRTGSFLVDLEMTERGIAYLERSLEASGTLQGDADCYAALAEAYKRIGKRDRYLEYAASYAETIETIVENGNPVTNQQSGLRHYYRGEILASQRQYREAYEAYENASMLITERFRLAEVYMVMADYQATARNADKAEELALLSANLIPEQAWKSRQTGGLLLRIGRWAKGVQYLERALEQSFSVQNRALSYAALADAYRSVNNRERFLGYAREYIALIRMHRDQLTDAEEGLAAFYQGEMYFYQGARALAYEEYERATNLLDNRTTRSEAFMRMAEIQAANGARQQATLLADKSADELPDQGWKLQQVGNFFMRWGMHDKALEYFRRYVEMSAPGDRLGVHVIMADAYKEMNRPEEYIRAAGDYIAAATVDGRVPSDEEKGMIAYYEAEIRFLKNEKEEANAAYERAAGLLTDKARLADVFMNLARFQADAGDRERAADFAMRSADARPDAENLRRVGDFLMELGMGDEAFAFFERYAAQASGLQGRSGVYSTMAEAYKRSGDQEKYLLFAAEYVTTIAAEGYAPTGEESGRAAFYRGELAAAKGDSGAAYAAYAEAADLVVEKYRLAEIQWKMARIEAERGNAENAAALAEKSAEALPHEAWKLKQVADFLLSLDMRDKALGYIERYVAETSGPGDVAAALAAWAEERKRAGDEKQYLYFADEYRKALDARGGPQSPAEEGLAAYYLGELQSSRREDDQAYLSYEKAARLLEDKNRRSEVFMKMAEHQARRGDRELAAELAGKAAETRPAHAETLLATGDFLLRLNLPDEALTYYIRYAELGGAPGARLFGLFKMAEAGKRLRDRDRYRQYASEYAALAASLESPSREQRGLAAYFRAEVAWIDGDRDAAFEEYREASELLSEKYRLAETLMQMAEIEAGRGNREEAAELTERSLALLPDEEWKIRQAADMFVRLGMPDRAIAMYERRLPDAGTPKRKAALYSQLADLYRTIGDEDKFLRYSGEYVDLVSTDDFHPTAEESGLRHYYRAEYHRSRNEPAEALAAYLDASRTLTDKRRLADVFMKMAELEADAGNDEQAARHVESALDLQPDEMTQWAAEMFIRLGTPEKAFDAFERRAFRARTPKENANVYLQMAETYRKMGDNDGYAEALGRHIELLDSVRDSLKPEELGMLEFRRGERYRALRQNSEALAAYGRAAELLTQRYNLSEALMRMAELEAGAGDAERAAQLAERSGELLPNEEWKIRQVAAFYSRLGMNDRAAEMYERRLRLADTPKKKAAAYAELADLHKKLGNAEEFARYAGSYVELVFSGEYAADEQEEALAFLYDGDLYLSRQQPDQAYRAYEAAARLFGDGSRAADALTAMAGIRLEQGDRADAGALLERAASLTPGDGQRLMEIAQFYSRMNMQDEAFAYYQRRLDLARTPADRAYVLSTIADAYRERRNREEYLRYAREYVELASSGRYPLSNEAKGLLHFYRGDLYSQESRYGDAAAELEQAVELFSGKYRKFETLMLLAEVHAKNDDNAAAIPYAEEAGELLPDSPWQQRSVGEFFANLNLMERALPYYRRFYDLAKTDRERITAYMTFADAYKRMGRNDEYLEYARRHVQAVALLGDSANDAEKGAAAFYRGDILTAEKRPHEAYHAYETAARYIKESYRLSETYAKMARHNARERNVELAARQARISADLTPGQYWRVREAAEILFGLRKYDEAIEVIEQALALNPEANVELYPLLSRIHVRDRRRLEGWRISRKYIDILIDQVETLGPEATREQHLRLWQAREEHASMTRLLPKMTVESTYSGRDYTDDSYTRHTQHEVNRYFYINRFIRGKFYGILSGSTGSYYFGTWKDQNDREWPWESRPDWEDSAHLRLGVAINPFQGPLMEALYLKAEHVFGLGHDEEHDFRFVVNYDRGSNTRPRLYERWWPYWKIWVDVPYSTRNNDITGSASLRRGLSIASPWDRNLVINPYAVAAFSYGGKDTPSSRRWGSEAGFGIHFKQYIGQTRYRTAWESVELDLYYRWGLTHGRKNGPGFVFTLKF